MNFNKYEYYVCRKITDILFMFLMYCNGMYLPQRKEYQFCCRHILSFLRNTSLFFINAYLFYRLLILVNYKNIAFDVFPLINSAVSAFTVNSIAIKYKSFNIFSRNMHIILKVYGIYIPKKDMTILLTFYAIFFAYVLISVTVFPSSSSHWFDVTATEVGHHDILHGPAVKGFVHVAIFIMCSGSVVISAMLYCLLCALLKQMLHVIYSELKRLQSTKIHLSDIDDTRMQFIEFANMVAISDNVFSLFGLVGLACVFARDCACIHFFLNIKSFESASFFFIFIQISFDTAGLTAICYYGASITEECHRLAPMVCLLCNKISPKCVNLQIHCLNLAKIMECSDVQMTAWKLFPFSRKILPTVIGLTLSYTAVIIQMHHASAKTNIQEVNLFTVSNTTV